MKFFFTVVCANSGGDGIHNGEGFVALLPNSAVLFSHSDPLTVLKEFCLFFFYYYLCC